MQLGVSNSMPIYIYIYIYTQKSLRNRVATCNPKLLVSDSMPKQ